MTTDREALLPCPFCGGRAEIQRGAYTKYVLCLKCAVMGPNLAADDELIAAWNRRAALTAQGGEQSADTVSVPREPTEAMMRAMHKADNDYSNNRFHGHGHLSRAEFVYRAMLAAAKEEK